MLPRIVLLLVQLAAAWFLADPIKRALPSLVAAQYDAFIYAIIYAIIVMIVGFAGSLVLKNVRVPTAATFIASLALALLLALATIFTEITQPLEQAVTVLRGSTRQILPLIGAFLGYYLKR